jgi:hypothetical protein
MTELPATNQRPKPLTATNDKALLIGSLCAPVAFTLIGVGLIICAGFVPPPSPSATGEQIRDMFMAHQFGIITGGVLMAIGAGGPFLAFICTISAVIRRTESGLPIFTYVQMLGGAFAAMVTLVSAMMWVTLGFRPDRDPGMMLMFNDFAWLFVLSTFSFGVIQNLAIAFAILGDDSPTPVFQRWVAYFNFWVAFLILPAGAIPFFKGGPFSWDGIISFWLVLIVFAVWTAVMPLALLRARRILNAAA